MGSTVTKAYQEQVVGLAVAHSLQINTGKQREQKKLLESFGTHLYVCYYVCGKQEIGCDYKHYFVTDRNWTIEFLKEGVSVHCNPLKEGYVTEKTFKMTPDVRARMEQVCGALGYNLCLRNCEQLARFLQSGSWVSMQMVPEGILRKHFLSHILEKHMLIFNKAPEELRNKAEAKSMYQANDYSGFVKFLMSPSAFSKADEEAFNVVFIGPTGAGKSHIINLLFNETVADSAPTAKSVTREMAIHSGSAQMYGLDGKLVERKVNVIDSVGLCDSDLSPEVVISLIKEHLKVNFMYLDRVVVVCSGRIEEAHSRSIKQLLTWLKYDKYTDNFLFLYNKSDLQPQALRDTNLGELCVALGIEPTRQLKLRNNFKLPSESLPENQDPSILRDGDNRVAVPLVKATGFPEGNFQDVQAELYELLDGTFGQIYDPRLNAVRMPVNDSWCSIL